LKLVRFNTLADDEEGGVNKTCTGKRKIILFAAGGDKQTGSLSSRWETRKPHKRQMFSETFNTRRKWKNKCRIVPPMEIFLFLALKRRVRLDFAICSELVLHKIKTTTRCGKMSVDNLYLENFLCNVNKRILKKIINIMDGFLLSPKRNYKLLTFSDFSKT
jgi:hypothetical protein